MAAAPVNAEPKFLIPDSILNSFADLIGFKGEDKAIRANSVILVLLNPSKKTKHYGDFLYKQLSQINIKTIDEKSFELVNTNNKSFNRIENPPIGKGVFGAVYKNMGTHVYKFIRLQDFEMVLEIFLEAFIQLVLQSDAEMGESICKIEGMFRQDAPGNNFYVILKLEYIETTLFSTLTDATRFEDFVPILKHIHHVLMYFREKYNFHHRDFHAENIMLKDGKIKIIDFGFACITYCGKTFSTNADSCESADLLLLITTIYDLVENLSVAFKKKLRTLLRNATRLYDIEPGLQHFIKFRTPNLVLNEKGRNLMKHFDKDFLVKLSSVDVDEAAYDAAIAAAAVARAAASAAAARRNAEKKADAELRELAKVEFNKKFDHSWTVEGMSAEIGKLEKYYDYDGEDGNKVVDQLQQTYTHAINLKKYLAGEDYEKEFPAVEIVKFLKEWQASFKANPDFYTPQRRIIKLMDLFIETNEHILHEFELYPKFLKTAILSLFETESILLTDKKIEELLAGKGGYRKRSNTKRRRQKRRKTTRR